MGNGVERNLLVVDFGVFPQIVQDDFVAACMFQTVPTSLINPTIRTWFGDRSWVFGDTWGDVWGAIGGVFLVLCQVFRGKATTNGLNIFAYS